MVNNAGITGPNVKTWEYPPADFRRVVEIDLVAPYLVSRALVPHMIERGYGRIVNIASVAGKEGNLNARRPTAPPRRADRPDQVARQGSWRPAAYCATV